MSFNFLMILRHTRKSPSNYYHYKPVDCITIYVTRSGKTGLINPCNITEDTALLLESKWLL